LPPRIGLAAPEAVAETHGRRRRGRQGVLAAIPLITAQISVDLLNAAVMVRV
jgi:hypothetical protein